MFGGDQDLGLDKFDFPRSVSGAYEPEMTVEEQQQELDATAAAATEAAEMDPASQDAAVPAMKEDAGESNGEAAGPKEEEEIAKDETPSDETAVKTEEESETEESATAATAATAETAETAETATGETQEEKIEPAVEESQASTQVETMDPSSTEEVKAVDPSVEPSVATDGIKDEVSEAPVTIDPEVKQGESQKSEENENSDAVPSS